MNERMTENIAESLEKIVNQNGPEFLTDEPYRVYTELTESGTADRKTAAALLHVLACGILETTDFGYDKEILSESIRRECSLNKRMSDRLAAILSALYSGNHRKEWICIN